jgi:integrase
MLQRTLPAGFIAPCLPTKTDKLPSGSDWLHEIKHDGFRIIARKNGERVRLYSRPGNDLIITHAFVKFVRRHGFQIRLHDLRHSHATHMLASGVHPKIAQERLGHSSVGITLDLYSHVLPGMQAEAVSRVDALLRDALNRRAVPNKKW